MPRGQAAQPDSAALNRTSRVEYIGDQRHAAYVTKCLIDAKTLASFSQTHFALAETGGKVLMNFLSLRTAARGLLAALYERVPGGRRSTYPRRGRVRTRWRRCRRGFRRRGTSCRRRWPSAAAARRSMAATRSPPASTERPTTAARSGSCRR